MKPIVDLAKQQGNTDERKKLKGTWLVQLGDHIQTVLERKRRMDSDKFDFEWWHHELWSYVSTLFPGPEERLLTPHGIESAYKKRKQRQTQRARRLNTVKRGK